MKIMKILKHPPNFWRVGPSIHNIWIFKLKEKHYTWQSTFLFASHCIHIYIYFSRLTTTCGCRGHGHGFEHRRGHRRDMQHGWLADWLAGWLTITRGREIILNYGHVFTISNRI